MTFVFGFLSYFDPLRPGMLVVFFQTLAPFVPVCWIPVVFFQTLIPFFPVRWVPVVNPCVLLCNYKRYLSWTDLPHLFFSLSIYIINYSLSSLQLLDIREK